MDERRNQLTDYEQTTTYFHALHDVRFKLLALIPIVSGSAIILIPANVSAEKQLALAIVGMVVTVGLTLYDQRNTLIYDRLILRAKMLEGSLDFDPLTVNDKAGGAFWARPTRGKILGIEVIWHDLGLALVYSASVGAWVFLAADALILSWPFGADRLNLTNTPWLLPVAATILTFSSLLALAKRNDRENKSIEAEIRNKIEQQSAERSNH